MVIMSNKIVLKKLVEIQEFINKLDKAKLKFYFLFKGIRHRAYLLESEKYLVVNELQQINTPLYLKKKDKAIFELETVQGFDLLRISFEASYFADSDHLGFNTYLFEFPMKLEYSLEIFTAYPTAEDSVLISFMLDKIQEYRKVGSINKNEIKFKGIYTRYKNFHASSLHGADLKLPFAKIKISGYFTCAANNDCIISGYAFKEEVEIEVQKYLEDYYIAENKIIPFRFPELTLDLDNLDKGKEFIPNTKIPVKIKVLILDDKEIVTEYLKSILNNKTNFVVSVCNDPLEFVTLLKNFLPHILIIDHNMPEVSGDYFVKYLKGNNLLNDQITILMLEYETASMKSSFEKNFDGVIVKPVDSKQLIDLITECLKRKYLEK